MNRNVDTLIQQKKQKRSTKRRWLTVVISLCLFVALSTGYMLINPATTKSNIAYCGIEEHTEHSDECYTQEKVLICTNTDPEHEHTDECYEMQSVLTCNLEPHSHTLQCFSNPEADTENRIEWESTFSDVELCGSWSDDLVAIAQTQLGYKESEENYIVLEDGQSVNGYTRYGDWYGDNYGDWSSMFVSFCLDYSGIGQEFFPVKEVPDNWIGELNAYYERTGVQLYAESPFYKQDSEEISPENYFIPEKGDLVFSDSDYNGECDHVGIISEAASGGDTFSVIVGDINGQVATISYSITNSSIMGYGILPTNPCPCKDCYDKYGHPTCDAGCSCSCHAENEQQFTLTVPAPQLAATALAPSLASAGSTSSSVLLVTGSDFQDPKTSYTSSDYAGNGNYTDQTNRISTILNLIKTEYGNAYGFIAGGDYCFDEVKSSSTKTTTGLTAVKNAVQGVFPSISDMVFVQGNHDATVSDIATLGANDTDYYGVFVLNESDYRAYPLTSSKWSDYAQSEAKAQTLANSLSAYLADKVANNYDKPIFVVSHVPLHFSTRSAANDDAIYADYFYNAISQYGDQLNIFFLYGHNHAWGDDDYLGGSSVLLQRGDTINIANHGSNSTYQAKTLNFTYLNFGYTGYYWSKWASSSSQVKYSNADGTLTMTAFIIDGSTVTISRWGESGVHNLKSAGAASQGNRGVAEVCTVTNNSIASPQTVSSPASGDNPGGDDPGGDEPGGDEPGGGDNPLSDTPVAIGNTGVLSKWNDFNYIIEVPSGTTYDAVRTRLGSSMTFTLYEFVVNNSSAIPSAGVEVYFPVNEEMRVFGYENGKIVWYNDAQYTTYNNHTYMVFTAKHFSYYGVAGNIEDFVFPENEQTEAGTYWVKCTEATDFANNGIYMIVSSSGVALGSNSSHAIKASAVTFTEKGTLNGVKYYEASGAGATDYFQFVYNNRKLKCVNSNISTYGLYFSSSSFQYRTSQTSLTFTAVSAANGTWRIAGGTNNYLQYANNTFSRSNKTNNATMTVYKQITVQGVTTNQLAVTKLVSEFNKNVTGDTAFTFRIVGSSANDYVSAAALTGEYTVYNPDNTIESEDNSLASGTFTLKAGQTALINVPKETEYYFVSEVFASSDKSISSTTGTINGTDTTALYASNESETTYTFPVSFDENDRSLIKVTNAPAEIDESLKVKVKIAGENENVPANTVFTVTVKDTNGNIVPYSQYQKIDEHGILIGKKLNYKADSPSINLTSGQSVRFYGLEAGTYVIEESYTPISDEVLDVYGKVNGTSSQVIKNDGYSQVIVNYNDNLDVEITDVVGGVTVTFDFADGTTETVIVDMGGTISEWPTKERSGMILQYWSSSRDVNGNYIEPVDQPTYEFTENTTLYAHWKTDPNIIAMEAEFSKTLKEETAYKSSSSPDNLENIFDIDLDVYLPPTDTAVVLVVDLSSSMDVQCLVCGAMHKNSSSGSTNNSTYDGGSATTTYNHAYVQRLGVTKTQATAFINRLSDALVAGQDCYVEIIGFAQTAWEVLGETNLATNKQAILDAITGMTSDSGTNIAAGLKMGYEKLTDILDSHGINAISSSVILLSDGAPTTNTQAISDGYSDPSSQYYLNCEDAITPEYIAKWQSIWSKYDHYVWHDTGFSSSATGGKYYNIRQLMAAPYYAEMIRVRGSRMFSVVVGTNMDQNPWQSANNYKYVSGIGIDNYDYIESFSNAAQFAPDAESLNDFFTDIADAIKITCTEGVITDPLSDIVEFIGFTDVTGIDMETNTTYHHNISADGTKIYSSVDNSLIGEYDPDTRTITWYPDNTGKLTYKIRLKNEEDNFIDYDDYGYNYLTNGETILEYTVIHEGFPDEHKTKNAEIPFVHGWLSDILLTKYGGLNNDSMAHVVSNVEFTLHHEVGMCAACQSLEASQRAVIDDIVITSDRNGIVDIYDIPSGHIYSLTETAQEKYAPACVYYLSIDNGVITVTPSEDDNGYWTGSNGTYRLFNLYTGGYELPSTGGSGEKPILYITGGLLIIAVTCEFGYFMRRRRERRNR